MGVHAGSEQHTHTLKEIFSQPRCWKECLRHLSNSEKVATAARMAKPGAEWILIGCGSSYYLALAAASTFNHLGLSARAIPASEILLHPELSIPKGREYVPVMISRSGLTSEVLRVTREFERRSVNTIAITCAEVQPLETLASVTIKLSAADEKSTVMTRSFTSMLLGLQHLAATVSGNEEFRKALLEMPDQVFPLLQDMPSNLRAFVQANKFADYVFLAQGALFGIANEAMLKVTESSCSYAQVFHTLEFRHGPKSIAAPETLISFFISERSSDDEVSVLEEMKELGASTFVVCNKVTDRMRKVADFTIQLGLTVPEVARLAAFTMWGQLYGVYTGLEKGLNPDSPRNLSRVVVLDGQH